MRSLKAFSMSILSTFEAPILFCVCDCDWVCICGREQVLICIAHTTLPPLPAAPLFTTNTNIYTRKRLAGAPGESSLLRRAPMRDACATCLDLTRYIRALDDGKPPAALQAARLQHTPPILRAHPLHKAMLTLTRDAFGLPCSLHRILSLSTG